MKLNTGRKPDWEHGLTVRLTANLVSIPGFCSHSACFIQSDLNWSKMAQIYSKLECIEGMPLGRRRASSKSDTDIFLVRERTVMRKIEEKKVFIASVKKNTTMKHCNFSVFHSCFPFFPIYHSYFELEDRIQLQIREKFSLQLLPFRKQVFLCSLYALF